jgi:hypothetical protein
VTTTKERANNPSDGITGGSDKDQDPEKMPKALKREFQKFHFISLSNLFSVVKLVDQKH